MNLQSDSETRRPRPRPGCPLLLLTQQLAVHQKELQQFYQKKTKVDLQITDPGIPWLHQFRHGALARRRHRNLSCCGFLVFPALPINSHMVHFRNLNWRYLTWVSHSKPKAWASPTKNLPNVPWKVGHPCFFCGSFRRRAQRRPRSRSVAGYATHHHDFICGQRMRTVEHEKMELYKN